MTEQEAIDFFATLYKGKHHIPGKVRSCGQGGWYITTPRGMSTFDSDELTKLVFMAHAMCYRVEMQPCMRYMKIMIHKRNSRNKASLFSGHPTIETAVERLGE